MSLQRIIVADRIILDNLFTEEGYDLEKSADNLAEMRGRIIMNYLEETYPGVEVCVDIGIQKESGPEQPVEVAAYISDEEMDPAQSAVIRQQLIEPLAVTKTDRTWAVRLS
ncbi:MAG: hypothetical protein GXY53_06215 [Desulfobulbus sp.]|nr:hypothetical protein [Desulfobulbus sp.]